MAPKVLLGICMSASSMSLFTTTAVLYSRHQSIDKATIQRSINRENKVSTDIISFCMRG